MGPSAALTAQRSHSSYQCQQHLSYSPTTKFFTTIHNISTSTIGVRSSTRTIFKSKWALFEKWCREYLVDFSTSSVKQVSYFFVYLYKDLNRRPLTIDGYRMAIIDTLGPGELHISQSSNLNRLLSSFHRDCPKSSRNLPKWNLSVVLNELTKAPFEPMKDTDLKHFTVKNSCLSCKQCIQFRPTGKGSFVPLFRFHSQKPTSKRKFSGDYSCFDYHCG